MVALPLLAKVAWDLLSNGDAELEPVYPFCAYLFLCSIFVAMTNQVRLLRMNNFSCMQLIFCLVDPQMVAHVLGPAALGHLPARLSPDTTQTSSPHPPCGTPRNLFLYYHRLAQLAPREDPVSESINLPDE